MTEPSRTPTQIYVRSKDLTDVAALLGDVPTEYVVDSASGDRIDLGIGNYETVSVQLAYDYPEVIPDCLDVEDGEVVYVIVHNVWAPQPEPGEHHLKGVQVGAGAAAGAARGLLLSLMQGGDY